MPRDWREQPAGGKGISALKDAFSSGAGAGGKARTWWDKKRYGGLTEDVVPKDYQTPAGFNSAFQAAVPAGHTPVAPMMTAQPTPGGFAQPLGFPGATAPPVAVEPPGTAMPTVTEQPRVPLAAAAPMLAPQQGVPLAGFESVVNDPLRTAAFNLTNSPLRYG